MARVFNGEFALMAWLDPKSLDEPDEFIDADESLSLERQAQRLLKGGKYKYIEIVRWNYDEQEYTDVLKVYPDDAIPLAAPTPLAMNKLSKSPPIKTNKRSRLKKPSTTTKTKNAKKAEKRETKTSGRRKRKSLRS